MIAVGDKIKILKAQCGAYGANGQCGYVIDKPSEESSIYNGLYYDTSGIFIKLENGHIWNVGTEIQYEILQKGDNRMSYESKKSVVSEVSIIVPNKVVEVTFMDGDKQKVVCQEPDVFDLESAIGICIAKHLCGGSSAYHKAIRNGIRVYKENLEKEKAIQEENERIAKKIAKRQTYMQRRAERRREEQIEIQKEAYIRALREVNSNKGE